MPWKQYVTAAKRRYKCQLEKTLPLAQNCLNVTYLLRANIAGLPSFIQISP